MTLLMLAMPVIAKAQFGFDVGSVEAYISDHKNQRSLLLARATLEQSNNLLHEYSAKAAEDYKVLKRNKLALQDTIIIRISLRCIDRISAEGKSLYRSVSDLVLYATGAAACSTSDLMLVLENINTSLDNIKKLLNAAYFDTWRYIQVRIGYWKESIYTPRSRSLIIEDAFGRWRQSGLNPYRNKK